jgi:hypothetical protein
MISHNGSGLPFLAKPWVSNFIQTRAPNERILPGSRHHSRDSAPKHVGASSGGHARFWTELRGGPAGRAADRARLILFESRKTRFGRRESKAM